MWPKKYLNSFGASRLHSASETTKIEQLHDSPSWQQAKTTLKCLARTGLLTLDKAKGNRLLLRWEPRVFPTEDIKPDAKQTLQAISHDLTLAFKNQREREMFERWLNKAELLTKEMV